MEALGNLAGEVAHDFKNMLTVIFTSVACLREAQRNEDLLTAGKLSAGELTEYLDWMQEASERSNEMIQRLLSFARPSVGKQEIIDFSEMIKEAVALCKATFPAEITIEAYTKLGLTAPGDSGQVHQVLMNLLINARDAMPDGGSILITAEKIPFNTALGLDVPLTPGDHIAISVSDDGPGMDDATKARIFEPFFTTKPTGKGTGLGLATVYGIATRHGGHTMVESTPGEGTTMRVFFPCQLSADEDSEPEPSRTRDIPKLEIEDNIVLLALADEHKFEGIQSRLESVSASPVVVTRSGAEAVQYIQQHRGGVLLTLLDQSLPDLAGVDAVRAIKGADPEARVVILATSVEEHEAEELRKAGALGVLPRSASSDQLQEAIQRVEDS